MTAGVPAPATLPLAGLPGLDPGWSRLVEVPDLDGVGRTFHVLDNGRIDPELTILCVHGNPSWSYLWRDLISQAPPGCRVVALDHLDMGYSERTGTVRRLDRRISDLSALTDRLGIDGPVVTVAHDWGGPISLGWAVAHREQLAGVVLSNTAVHQPAGSSAPWLIRLARAKPLLGAVAVRTSGFVRAAFELSRSRPPKQIRDAYLAPYSSPGRRTAVADFVADIPLEPDHPSAPTLDEIAARLVELEDVPALLLWGPSDPVFSDRYLHDLESRLPRASVHRFVGARHYVPEDAEVASTVVAWLGSLGEQVSRPDPTERSPLWAGIDRRAADTEVAVLEMTPDGPGRSVTFADLATDVGLVAAGLARSGVSPGDRVALLVPPGVDLTVCLYACWRMGAVTVVADAGLGARGMGAALRAAAPDFLVGIPKALAAARALGWPGRRIAVDEPSGAARRMLGVWSSLNEIRRLGEGAPLPTAPGPDDLAAVAFTSGATGPAKGVRYRHHQAQAQRDALASLYGIGPDDRLVAAFAPFALYGAAMGIPSVVPDMDVTAPATLDAAALGEAVAAIEATLVFASPAALANVCDTTDSLTQRHRSALSRVRLLMSAGAPVTPSLLQRAAAVMPNAEPHTPYGMTEVLPVADVTLGAIIDAGDGEGVCVGFPIEGVEVVVDPLDGLGAPLGDPTSQPGVSGEVCIRAEHVRDGYDRLWLTEHLASQPPGWHRSGDVGHIDEEGRLWIEGRLVHVISTDRGPISPVSIEHDAQSVGSIDRAAAVGVGPVGTQQVVVVVEPSPRPRRPGLASRELTDRVREAASVEIAAVLVVPALPVDVRHNSKIDRTRVAEWAGGVLAGERVRSV